ncbi:MAG TPA: hypothetical protein VIG69_11625, partial [Candidatus Methylomirabilis sp.]
MAQKVARGETGKGQAKKAAKRRKNIIAGTIVGLAVVAVLVVGYLAMSGGPRRTADGLIAKGEEAPAFSLPRLGGSGSVS